MRLTSCAAVPFGMTTDDLRLPYGQTPMPSPSSPTKHTSLPAPPNTQAKDPSCGNGKSIESAVCHAKSESIGNEGTLDFEKPKALPLTILQQQPKPTNAAEDKVATI